MNKVYEGYPETGQIIIRESSDSLNSELINSLDAISYKTLFIKEDINFNSNLLPFKNYTYGEVSIKKLSCWEVVTEAAYNKAVKILTDFCYTPTIKY